MAGNIPYIGSKISLITTSDIRYEGILYTLNREESTIAVQNVRSFGTEGRRVPEVTMSNEIYDFIIFRGKDLKDLTVLQGAPERTVPSTFNGDYQDQQGVGSSAYGQQHSAQQDQVNTRSNGYLSTASIAHQTSAAGNSYGLGGGYGGAPIGSTGSRLAEKTSSSSAGCGAGVAGGVAGAQALAHSRQYTGTTSAVQAEYQAAQLQSPYEETNGGMPARSDHIDGKGSMSRGHLPENDFLGPDGRDPKVEPRPRPDEARGRGKGGPAQKKQLFEVLRFHKRAEEAIVKMIRSQSASSLGPAELRAMSELNPSVYHFYLDFVNYCLPSPVVQTDEQQWEMLCKALKKHFEKEFGANQSQKVAQLQRPNNTLGDFITIQPAKAKAKAKGTGTKPPGRGGPGRGDKKDGPGGVEADAPGEDDHAPAQCKTWACPRCTLRNENILHECAACGTSKQQAALWAEFPPLG